MKKNIKAILFLFLWSQSLFAMPKESLDERFKWHEKAQKEILKIKEGSRNFLKMRVNGQEVGFIFVSGRQEQQAPWRNVRNYLEESSLIEDLTSFLNKVVGYQKEKQMIVRDIHSEMAALLYLFRDKNNPYKPWENQALEIDMASRWDACTKQCKIMLKSFVDKYPKVVILYSGGQSYFDSRGKKSWKHEVRYQIYKKGTDITDPKTEREIKNDFLN